jgi:hypothetical protein
LVLNGKYINEDRSLAKFMKKQISRDMAERIPAGDSEIKFDFQELEVGDSVQDVIFGWLKVKKIKRIKTNISYITVEKGAELFDNIYYSDGRGILSQERPSLIKIRKAPKVDHILEKEFEPNKPNYVISFKIDKEGKKIYSIDTFYAIQFVGTKYYDRKNIHEVIEILRREEEIKSV